VTTWLRAPLGRLLRSELRWVLRRPRTQVALVLLALVPVVTGLGIAAAGSPASAGLLTQVAGNGLVLPVVALSICLTLLFPLAVAMAAADALAGESAHATLRGLLLAPISRSRLVLVKSIGVLAVAVAAVASVAVLGIVTGLILVGPASSTHGMLTLSGTEVGPGSALMRVALAAVWTVGQLAAVGTRGRAGRADRIRSAFRDPGPGLAAAPAAHPGLVCHHRRAARPDAAGRAGFQHCPRRVLPGDRGRADTGPDGHPRSVTPTVPLVLGKVHKRP
jgi:hypothetical protein